MMIFTLDIPRVVLRVAEVAVHRERNQLFYNQSSINSRPFVWGGGLGGGDAGWSGWVVSATRC